MEKVGDYRGIALGCSVVKVSVKVLARQLGRFAEDMILTVVQGGVRSGMMKLYVKTCSNSIKHFLIFNYNP